MSDDPGWFTGNLVSETAARHGASVTRATDDPKDAWAQVGFGMDFELRPLPWPPAGG